MPTVTTSSRWKYQLGKKQVDIRTDVFKAVLMGSGFSFAPGVHGTYADISGSELADGNGYSVGGLTLSGGTFTQDDAENKAYRTFNAVQWTPTGGDIGPFLAVVVIDTSTSDNTVVGCYEYGTSYTFSPGMTLTIDDLTISITEPGA